MNTLSPLSIGVPATIHITVKMSMSGSTGPFLRGYRNNALMDHSVATVTASWQIPSGTNWSLATRIKDLSEEETRKPGKPIHTNGITGSNTSSGSFLWNFLHRIEKIMNEKILRRILRRYRKLKFFILYSLTHLISFERISSSPGCFDSSFFKLRETHPSVSRTPTSIPQIAVV